MNLAADIRYAFRMIRKTPGASAVAVLSLALGIGANTAIFSLVDTMLLKLLPVRAPQELYQLVTGTAARYDTSWNYPDYVAFRDNNHAFSGLAAASGTQAWGMQLVDSPAGTPTELVSGMMVTGNYFDVLGVGPALGQLFNTEVDHAPGTSPYAVLNYEYWQARLQGDPQVVGRKLRLNGYPFTIIGVTRPGFRSTDISQKPDLYIPLLMRSEVTGRPFANWNNRHNWWASVLGRIRPDVNTKQAETELLAIFKAQEEGERREAKDPRNVSTASQVTLFPGARGYSGVRNRLKQPLVVLMIVVGLVLVIACANVANLMLARGAARQREIAVRLAVGASRSRLAAQLLTESIVLALIGGTAGLAVAYGGVQVLLGFLPQAGGFGKATLAVAPDWRLLGFAAGVSLLTGMLFGLAPALASTRPRLVTALKEDTPGSGSSRFGLRNVLVVVQVSLSLLLVIGASLFLRSLDSLRGLEMGFRRDHTVVAFVDAGRNGYKGQRLRDFYERLLSDVKAIPGVQSASLAEITPLEGSRWNGRVAIEGYTPKPKERMVADMNAVGPRFFETLGIPLLAGREFHDQDNPPVSQDPSVTLNLDQTPIPPGPRVVTVNESFVKKYFTGRNPIGMHLCLDEKYDGSRAYEIVGVVKDARYFGLRRDTEAMVYQPVWRPQASSKSISIRTSRQSAGMGESVRRAVTAVDPAVPLLNLRSIEQQIDNNILEDRLLTTLSGFLGALALLLAAVGLYGVVSFAVTRRTREIGIRMALGAERPSVVWLVAKYAFALVVAGAAIGVPTALALSKLLKSFLFGIAPQDPVAIAGAVATLAAAAALACYLPAMRATKVDPMVALRHD